MEDAILYVRVSTQEQAQHGVSLQAQEERLRAYCAAVGLNVVRVIREEGVSAGRPLQARPGGSKMLRAFDEKDAEHIVALKLDRLFRSTEDALHWTQAFEKQGLTLHLTDMGGQNLNTGSAMGRMMLTLLAAFAEFEKNLIAERTATALEHKKRNRQVYGHAPYGFDVSDAGKDLLPNESEQKTLKYIFQWRQEGASLHVIATRLNELGVPSKKGGKWHAATVAHIVNNELYRDKADNLVPWPPGGKRTESAEEQLLGQMMPSPADRE